MFILRTRSHCVLPWTPERNVRFDHTVRQTRGLCKGLTKFARLFWGTSNFERAEYSYFHVEELGHIR